MSKQKAARLCWRWPANSFFLGDEPCCLSHSQLSTGEWVSHHWGHGRWGDGAHILEMGAKLQGKLRGLRGLDCPPEKNMLWSGWMLVTRGCPLLQQNGSTARDCSWKSVGYSGNSGAPQLSWRGGEALLQVLCTMGEARVTARTAPVDLAESLSSGSVCMAQLMQNHSAVNPALPAAKLHSACEGHGGKSLWNPPFSNTPSPLHRGPWPCSHLQISLYNGVCRAVAESASVCADEWVMRVSACSLTPALLPCSAQCSRYGWSLKIHR